jgi:cytidine deaminase
MTIDWARLRAAAVDAASRAYAPYSRLRVGAAGVTFDGRLVTGCNVENASYGLTLCAECGLVSALHATAPSVNAPLDGEAADHGAAAAAPGDVASALLAVAVVAGDGAPLMPCGRCRQLLLEAGGPSMLVDTAGGPIPLSRLLPAAFGTEDLDTRRDGDREAQRASASGAWSDPASRGGPEE